MSHFNAMMSNHFAGKKLLAEEYVEHYKRTFKIFYLDRTDIIGISDGHTAWVASPISCFPKLKLVELVTRESSGSGVRQRRTLNV